MNKNLRVNLRVNYDGDILIPDFTEVFISILN